MSDEKPYTPHTTGIRMSYVLTARETDPELTRDEAKAEFNRWRASVERKALREAATALDNDPDYPMGASAQTAAAEWLRTYAETWEPS